MAESMWDEIAMLRKKQAVCRLFVALSAFLVGRQLSAVLKGQSPFLLIGFLVISVAALIGSMRCGDQISRLLATLRRR